MLIANLTSALNKGGNNTEEVFLSIDGKIVDFIVSTVALSDGAKILEVNVIPTAEKEATVDAPLETIVSDVVIGAGIINASESVTSTASIPSDAAMTNTTTIPKVKK
jgi:hypothetical protein